MANNQNPLALAELALQQINKMAQVLDPKKAKVAALWLRQLRDDNEKLAEENQELKTKLAELNKFDECLDLAEEMADGGFIANNSKSIREKAAELRGVKDLGAVKEGIKLAHDKFATVSENTSDAMGSGLDCLTQAILDYNS